MEIKKLIIYLTFINIFVVFFIDKIAHVYNVFDQTK